MHLWTPVPFVVCAVLSFMQSLNIQMLVSKYLEILISVLINARFEVK